jgi:hypothetical protein
MTVRRVSDGRGGQCDADIAAAIDAMYDRMDQALTANQTAQTVNATYVALASPSTAQNTAQIKALSNQQTTLLKECSALIRLVLGKLDSTAGT